MAMERKPDLIMVNSQIHILEAQLIMAIKRRAALIGERPPIKHVLTVRPLESVFERARRRANGIPDSDAIRRGLELL